MKRIYTEIRVPHKTEEDKARFEQYLDEAIEAATNGSRTRSEWIYEKCCQLIGELYLKRYGTKEMK